MAPLKRPHRVHAGIRRQRIEATETPRTLPLALIVAASLALLGLLAVWLDEGFQSDPYSAAHAVDKERASLITRLSKLEERRRYLQWVKDSVGPAMAGRPRSDFNPDRPSPLNNAEFAIDGWNGWLEKRYESVEEKVQEADKYLRQVEEEVEVVLNGIRDKEKEATHLRASGVKRDSWVRRLVSQVYGDMP